MNVKFPKALKPGDTIGVCAPSSGVTGKQLPRLDQAIANVEALGYRVLETPSVRSCVKCVGGDAETRAAELMALYENPTVAAIIPPWGGEFLMDMLPFLDFERLSSLPPKWICGFSDITTLLFPVTLCCDVATLHGSNLMNMGYARIHDSDLAAFESMSVSAITQKSAPDWGTYSGDDLEKEIYSLSNKSSWKSLYGQDAHSFEGRVISGCMDTLCCLLGTRFAPVERFLERYKGDGFIWALESCEMNAADIYRTLWQMRTCGWFAHCNGILFGRPGGYSDARDFTLTDALEQSFAALHVPVIYDVDVGHIPPQMQIVNGAYGTVDYREGQATVTQEFRP